MDLVTFTQEILNGKLHYLCSVSQSYCQVFTSVNYLVSQLVYYVDNIIRYYVRRKYIHFRFLSCVCWTFSKLLLMLFIFMVIYLFIYLFLFLLLCYGYNLNVKLQCVFCFRIEKKVEIIIIKFL